MFPSNTVLTKTLIEGQEWLTEYKLTLILPTLTQVTEDTSFLLNRTVTVQSPTPPFAWERLCNKPNCNSFFPLGRWGVYFYFWGLNLIWALQRHEWLAPSVFLALWFNVQISPCRQRGLKEKRCKVLRCFVSSLPARSIKHENQYPMPRRKYKPAAHISGYQCIITYLSFLPDLYKQPSEVPCLRNTCVIMPGCRNEKADKKI